MTKKRLLKLLSLVCAVSLLTGCWADPPMDSMGLPIQEETEEPEEAVALPTAFTLPYAPDQTLDPVTCPDGIQQVVGSLLVLALLITPAAAALQITASPLRALILSVLFAEAAMVGGILLALAGSLPISPYVTTLSFLIFVACRLVRAVRQRYSASGRVRSSEAAVAPSPAGGQSS